MGQFDALIRQELMRNNSQRGEDPNQRARDFAARQMNAQRGGPPSTAWAEANRAPIVADNPQDSPGLPARAPVPTSNPMNAAIDDQMAAENPMSGPMQMGDASVMEAAAQMPARDGQPAAPPQDMGDASVAEAAQSGLEQAIAAQVGDEEAPMAADPTVAPVPGTNAPADNGSGLAKAGMLAASLGSGAAALKLYQSYMAGDPDATAIFKANGVDPEDFSMFVTGDAAVDRRAGSGTTSASGKQAKPTAADAAKSKSKASGQNAQAAKPKSGSDGKVKPKMPDQTSAPMPPWMKPKVKVK